MDEENKQKLEQAKNDMQSQEQGQQEQGQQGQGQRSGEGQACCSGQSSEKKDDHMKSHNMGPSQDDESSAKASEESGSQSKKTDESKEGEEIDMSKMRDLGAPDKNKEEQEKKNSEA